MKVHLRKRYRKNGKNMVSRTNAECGKHVFGYVGGNSSANLHMFKTTAFREIYESEGENAVCKNCLKRAKEQGRI